MKYFRWLIGSLVLAGCAVGSTAETSDAPAAPTASALDAGGSAPTATLPASPPSADAGEDGSDDDASSSDASTPLVDAGKPDAPPTGPCTFTGELAAYDLTKIVGTADLAATSTGGSVTASVLSRAGVTAVSSSQAMNASDWSTGAADKTKHYVFSVTPPAGCSLELTSLAIDLKASGTGPSSAAVATSLDGFAALQTVAVTTAGGATSVPLSGTASSTIEVHVLGFSASSAAGTMRIQNSMSLVGKVTP